MEKRKDYIIVEPIIKEMREDIKAILKILNGNGSIGLVAKVQVLWGVTIILSGTVLTIIGKWVTDVLKGN